MTIVLALILAPTLAGVAAFFIRSTALRRGILVLTALAHSGLTAAAWTLRATGGSGTGSGLGAGAWLGLDGAGILFLATTSALFLASAVYAVGFLRRESRAAASDLQESLIFRNAPEAVFTGCMLLFLAAMTLVTLSRNLGLLWVAVEATTLASAPLIYFHRSPRSLEATWKYLLVCSVGIALALLGTFFLGVAAAAAGPGGKPLSLMLDDLLAGAPGLQVPWLKAAFILLLVGYGTKMGLAPLHTWLPDAHSESPSVVSALLSGAVLNCAFLGILRVHQVCIAASQEAFAQDLLVLLGLLSLAVAAVFILGQTDYKRLLAYSSVEHMGILSLGVGLGGVGAFGSAFHAINHSFTKAMLFLLAGNILAVYGTKTIAGVRGVARVLPFSGILWLAGFFAVTGTPPFGSFWSELTILKAAVDQHREVVGALYLAFLALIFMGTATAFLHMAQGEPSPGASAARLRGRWLSQAPAAALGIAVLALGLYMPLGLRQLLEEVATMLGGTMLGGAMPGGLR
jgi:hydrogenase-4 component F